jgi:hypothetical protein
VCATLLVVTTAVGDLLTRIDLALSGVVRLAGLTPRGAIVETYADGRWVESRTGAPIDAYRPATPPEIVAARHDGRVPPPTGLFPIDDDELREALHRPGLTEREVDAIMLDPTRDRALKMRLIGYVTALGYPTRP